MSRPAVPWNVRFLELYIHNIKARSSGAINQSFDEWGEGKRLKKKWIAGTFENVLSFFFFANHLTMRFWD